MYQPLLQIVTTKPEWHGRVPHVLSQECHPVPLGNPDIRDIVRDVCFEMFRTLYQSVGVGIAAPQCGILWQLVVIDTTWLVPLTGLRSDEQRRHLILINPEILFLSEEVEQDKEVCLSLPGYVAKPERPVFLRLRNNRLDGSDEVIEAEGYLARVILHEIDHLKGKLYPDVIKSTEEISAVHLQFAARASDAMARTIGI